MKKILIISVLILFNSQLYSKDSLNIKINPYLKKQIANIEIYNNSVLNFLEINPVNLLMEARAAYDEKDYEKSAKYYIIALKYDAQNYIALYNLACCYSLLGKDSLSVKLLRKAVSAGFEDINHIENDPDFEKIRYTNTYQEALKEIKLNQEEKKRKQGHVDYLKSSILFQYRTYLPENYDSTQTYPIIIGLHGYGSNITRFIEIGKEISKSDYPIIYITPQAPYPFAVQKEVGYSWEILSENEDLQKKAKLITEEYVIKLLDKVKKEYNPKEIFLFGFSQGCANTYTIGLKNYDKFSGLICFGGWLDKDWLSKEELLAANELKVFIAHGKKDNIVKLEDAEKTNICLKENNYDVTLYLFDGKHEIPEKALKNVIEWIRK